jgi:hypothetical protein
MCLLQDMSMGGGGGEGSVVCEKAGQMVWLILYSSSIYSNVLQLVEGFSSVLFILIIMNIRDA